MLSYLHPFHAGNHADVLKHWLLLECVRYLQLKSKPFVYIDTHSGNGMYRTDSMEALKTNEIFDGVLKINWENFPELDLYRELVSGELKNGSYPGSPSIVKQLLRADDTAWFFEMHPQVVKDLRVHCEKKGQCYVRQEDGFKGLLSLFPVPNGRALVLIDPSYEVKSDYHTVVDILQKAYKKMPQATLALWYPMVSRGTIDALEAKIKKTTLKNTQLYEMGVAEDAALGMTASGMIIVNPPWTLSALYRRVAGCLSSALSKDGSERWRCEQLVAE
ncbi:23S rRNA (adenine(2030)-N(6))-methyltransferase RlmJ [Aurantivibrio plasticivorans]